MKLIGWLPGLQCDAGAPGMHIHWMGEGHTAPLAASIPMTLKGFSNRNANCPVVGLPTTGTAGTETAKPVRPRSLAAPSRFRTPPWVSLISGKSNEEANRGAAHLGRCLVAGYSHTTGRQRARGKYLAWANARRQTMRGEANEFVAFMRGSSSPAASPPCIHKLSPPPCKPCATAVQQVEHGSPGASCGTGGAAANLPGCMRSGRGNRVHSCT